MILLDPKKITRFIVDVTNTRDKECLANVTKALITGKTILTESELETVQNLTQHGIIPYTVICVCSYITQRLLHIYTNKLKQLCKQCIAPLSV